jgi:hypothetical protein
MLASARSVAADGAAPARVRLEVLSDDPALGRREVEAALARTMGSGVTVVEAADPGPAAVLTIAYRPSRGELAVSYQEPGRGAVSRVVEAPARSDEVARAAALLAASLIRDDAEALLGPRPVVPPPPAPPAPSAPVVRPIVLSFFHPVSTNHDEPQVTARLHLNLFYGYVGGLDGVALGTATVVGRDARGLALALLWNRTRGSSEGIFLAGAANWSDGAVRGWQGAFGFNRAAGGVVGLQSGFVNSSGASVAGVQVGGVNVAGDVDGVQLGIVNVAGVVRGVQLGLVNVADDVHGMPIGIVNVTSAGGVHPLAWASSRSLANAGVKFATRYTYSLFSFAAHRERDVSLYGPGVAFGARLPLEPVAFETDVGATYLFGGPLWRVSGHDGVRDDVLRTRWRALVSVALHRRFSIFVGGGLTLTTRFNQPGEGFTVPAAGITPPEETTFQLGPEAFGGIQL